MSRWIYFLPLRATRPYRGDNMNETTQASYNPYESYLLMSPPLPPPPPPPPPDSMPRRSHKLWKIALPIFCLLLLIIGIFFYPFLTSLLHAKNAATGGKVAHSYTATDILHAFLAAGIPTSYIQYNDDIWSFIGDDHPPIDIEPSVSSVWFYEDVPGAIGVWVYATSAQAKQTGAEVAA